MRRSPARVAEYRLAVDLLIARHMSPAAASAKLAAFAKQKVAEVIASGRAPPQYRRFVDGVEGAPEEAVRADGAILYRFAVLAEAVAFALSFLRERSPARSGAFRNSFALFVREGGSYGSLIRAASFSTQKLSPRADEVTIVNLQPYSRLVDVQQAGKRPVRYTVPPNLYADAGAAVKRRFPGTATQRAYRVQMPRPYLLRSPGRNQGRPVETPGLIISLRR